MKSKICTDFEIPFGAFDSELAYQEIHIPNGFEATIEENKIILKKAESEDEKIRKALIDYFNPSTNPSDCKFKGEFPLEHIVAWLEKQGENSPVLSNSLNIGKDLQVDGFDAELNALLKKYEYLPDDELIECLKFYTAVIINNKQRMEE